MESIMIVITLLGGLGLFVYGMKLMGDGLENAAGDGLKKILEKVTSNPITAVLIGAAVTAVIQSSSATTVMVVGFVNAGLMNLTQAVGIIMGANIGTTITAQLVAFKLDEIAPLFVFIGAAIVMFAKGKKRKEIGNIILGFGILFTGMGIMSSSMEPLTNSEVFKEVLVTIGDNWPIGILAGAVITAVLQSSSATTGILVGLATAGAIDIKIALPIVFGCNIGTCVTAILSSVGANKTAHKAAAMHLIFNILGTIIFIPFLGILGDFVYKLSPNDVQRQIANAHTVFNITMTLIWVCLIKLMVKIVMTLIPDGKKGVEDPGSPIYLDENIISQPAAALQLVAKEIFRMSDQVRDILKKTIELVKNEEVKSIDGLKENGEQVERLGKCITEYLAALFSSGSLTEQQAAQTASLMCVLSDVERMGTLSVEMAECMLERSDRKYKYTPEAMDELQKSLKVLNKMFCDSLKALQGDDGIEPGKMMKRKDKLLDLDIKMRKAHIERVNKGKCKASLTAPFTNILHLIDRMGNSCINLADVAESGTSMKYFMLEEK